MPSRRSANKPAERRRRPWHETVQLPDGRALLVRPIRPEDAEPLRAGFDLLHPEEIRQRFLYQLKELTPEMALRLCTPDPKREFALVAAEPLPPGSALVGAVARAAIDDESMRRAEFAILVSHFLAGQGLGRLLMRRLVRWARLKRLDTLYGDVLEHNHTMLGLARSLGFEHVPGDQTPGVARIALALR